MYLKFGTRLVKSIDPPSMLSRPGVSVSPENTLPTQNHGLVPHLLSPKFQGAAL